MALPRPRVLVTGAAGFVGGWLLRKLATGLPEDSIVIGAGFGGHAGAGPVVDITDATRVAALVQLARPTCVVHLAAVSNVGEARKHDRRAWDVNLFGTKNLAQALLQHAPEAHLIFASTSEVYGAVFNTIGRPLDETAPLSPTNMYAATKASADLLLGVMAREGLRVTRFRPFNHTGPGQTPQFVVPAFVSQIVAIERGRQEPVIRVGNLEARRDFLDVRDVTEAYRLAILASDLRPGIVLNLASGVDTRIGDVLESLLALAKVPIRVANDPARMRPNDLPVAVGDASAARDTLGWRPSIGLEQTLKDMLEAERARPDRPEQTTPG